MSESRFRPCLPSENNALNTAIYFKRLNYRGFVFGKLFVHNSRYHGMRLGNNRKCEYEAKRVNEYR